MMMAPLQFQMRNTTNLIAETLQNLLSMILSLFSDCAVFSVATVEESRRK